ncbi:hydroxysqualene dehydroxylase HpnE [Massilia sp. YIM B02763]|uniref:hydroxysqualene dehydroxylase HpnE n=1 Tax=Massilia sp. YIM B02763 TaxID=3050130 RepID=UPI0025B633E7|nr:hydroxysqualene dehydroxylase HpnE [Massilia sp. YIM B02763]MDN4054917.1 hydroxysqualene dehydroxylase HpnE [Massilia sp. YIM B02763]
MLKADSEADSEADCAADGADVAVVGGGWAGCAAAVELAAAGCRVTLYEAARTLGGRARAVEVKGPTGERRLDNGQHILLGAYKDSLKLLRRVGVDPRAAFLRLPLQMRYPPASGLMDFVAPRLPAPLHVLAALLRAKGLAREDKLALARFSTSARWMGWQLHADCSVTELLERFDQTPRLQRLLWAPLCIAALNTPPERASARVFLAVLRDSLGAKRAASDMLLPRVLLDALFPDAARGWLEGRGARVLTGTRVGSIAQDGTRWRVGNDAGCLVHDALVVAAPPWQAASLLRALPGLEQTCAQLDAFAYEPISTVYLQYDPGTRLPLPFCALLDAPERGLWGQFAFDRGQLDADDEGGKDGQDGLLAVVVSAAGDAAAQPQEALARAVAAQLADAFAMPGLAASRWSQVITEKRATFACAPGLARPANATALPGLFLAGDYTASDYPATLEAAVRSGVQAAQALLKGRAP